MSRAITWVALSLAVHVALATAIPARTGGGGAAFPVPPMQVRMISLAREPVPDTVAVDAPALTEEPTSGEAARDPAPIGSVAAASNANSGTPDEFDPSLYIASSTLPVRPEPIGNIAVPYPTEVKRSGIVSLGLTLYIDEAGRVVHIDLDDTTLPPAFHQAAWMAFSKGRFQPGRIDEGPVKTRMRVEVLFEDNTTPAADHA